MRVDCWPHTWFRVSCILWARPKILALCSSIGEGSLSIPTPRKVWQCPLAVAPMLGRARRKSDQLFNTTLVLPSLEVRPVGYSGLPGSPAPRVLELGAIMRVGRRLEVVRRGLWSPQGPGAEI